MNAAVRFVASTASQLLALHSHQQLVPRDAGIAHDDIEPAVLLDDAARQPRQGRTVGHVDADGLGPPALRGDGLPVSLACSPRAAATQCALRGELVAIARPMPRDAPVTSATFPSDRTSHQGPTGPARPASTRSIVRHAEAQDRRLAVNLPNEPAQHGPRAHLNIRCDAFRRKATDDFLPSNREMKLCDKSLDRAVDRRHTFRFGIHVRHDRHMRIGPATRAVPAQAVLPQAPSARSGTAR